MRPALLVAVLCLGLTTRAADATRVATLHPFLSEITRILCGDRVEVVELLGTGANPHTFDPKPEDLAKVQGAVLLLAMGKNLEPYLDRVSASLPETTRVVEAGRPVPSLRIDVTDEVFLCCPSHSHGAIDPHWWHSPEAMRRAVRGLEKVFIETFPEAREDIQARSRAYQNQLRELDAWAKTRLYAVPRSQRKLVTAHAAFGYFCEAYGFQAIPVQGLDGARAPTQNYLAETIRHIRAHQVKAVFPEANANPAALSTIARETGATIAEPLLAGNLTGRETSYVAFFRYNVNVIANALGAPPTER